MGTTEGGINLRTQGEEILSGQFLRKAGSFILWNSYKLRCSLCGNEKTVRIYPFGKRYRTHKLLRQLNTCHKCGHRVCDDCYVITDGSHMIDGVCGACAADLGISGKTTTEIINGSVTHSGKREE